MGHFKSNEARAEGAPLHPALAQALWPLTQAIPRPPAAPPRSDWSAIDAVKALIADMPFPTEEELQSIVEALARKLTCHVRFNAVVDALGDVHAALEDAKPAPLDCGCCGGSGTSRHNGSSCITCGGRGEVAP